MGRPLRTYHRFVMLLLLPHIAGPPAQFGYRSRLGGSVADVGGCEWLFGAGISIAFKHCSHTGKVQVKLV